MIFSPYSGALGYIFFILYEVWNNLIALIRVLSLQISSQCLSTYKNKQRADPLPVSKQMGTSTTNYVKSV